jgi:hypothetical protein
MGCQCILLATKTSPRVLMFGLDNDHKRTDVLHTSVLIQMSHGLAATVVPERASPRAQLAARVRRGGHQPGEGR